MGTTDTETRDAFINGLFELAIYLAAHPGVPVPNYGTRILVPSRDIEDNGISDVDAAAEALNALVHSYCDDYGNDSIETGRSFGPVDYKVYALSKESMTRHRAESTYHGCIKPDKAA